MTMCDRVGLVALILIVVVLQSATLNNMEVDPVEFSVTVENGTVLEFEATAYAIGPPYNSITRNGQPVMSRGFITVGGMEVFSVAADPNVLPLNSIIYIEGLGLGLVDDTGPAIKGMKLDICLQNMDLAMKFGRKKVEVIVLRRGSQDE